MSPTPATSRRRTRHCQSDTKRGKIHSVNKMQSLRTASNASFLKKYNYSLCNNPEERSSQLLRGGSLKTRQMQSSFSVAPGGALAIAGSVY